MFDEVTGSYNELKMNKGSDIETNKIYRMNDVLIYLLYGLADRRLQSILPLGFPRTICPLFRQNAYPPRDRQTGELT